MRTRELVLHIVVFAFAATDTVLAQPEQCPARHRALLQAYKEFHDAKRNDPDTKYILDTCWSSSCQGTGDRIRGILWSLRLAVTYRRVLLIDWTHPGPITKYLLPSYIDWSTQGFDRKWLRGPLSPMSEVEGLWGEAKRFFRQLASKRGSGSGEDYGGGDYGEGEGGSSGDGDGDVKSLVGEQLGDAGPQILRLKTNKHFHGDVPGALPFERDEEVAMGNCYFHFLFKPHPVVVSRAEEHLAHIYGPQPAPPYVAWHWRHGDASTRTEQPVMISHLEGALDCAKSLAYGSSTAGGDSSDSSGSHLVSAAVDSPGPGPHLSPSVPLLLVSDFNAARHFIRKGYLTNVATPNITAMHIDKDQSLVGGGSRARGDAFLDVFVELTLLSRAACLLTSHSGFSLTALWMSDNPGLAACHRDWKTCAPTTLWRRQRRRRR